MDSAAFRRHGHELVDWIAEYLEHPEKYPVLARVKPGEIASARTSPAATELESVVLGWLRKLIGLPDTFEGVIYDTASIATMHALVAAREAAVPAVRTKGLAGRSDIPRMRVYCSEQAHSSV